MKQNIRRLGYVLISSLAVLPFYLGYLSVVRGPALKANPYNHRLAYYEAVLQGGTIFNRRGSAPATTLPGEEGSRRLYPRGRGTAQVVGFVSARFGRTGLEAACDQELLDLTPAGKIRAVADRLPGRPHRGNDVVLTQSGRPWNRSGRFCKENRCLKLR